MYQKYTTDCIVLSSRERGENDRLYSLYTQQFGLVQARAGNVRAMSSKMRMGLTLYAVARVTLIKGKAGWRVAGVRAEESAFGVSAERMAAFARIAALIIRLIHGEEEHGYLYESLLSARSGIFRDEAILLPTIELVAVARTLYALGYLSRDALELTLLTHTAIGVADIAEAEEKKQKLLHSINGALQETHL